MKIPKTIHQIWLGPHELPWAWIENWKSMNPDWTHRLWRDSDVCLDSNRKQYHACQTYSGKANIMRCQILEQYGGLYLDADFEPRRPLNELDVEYQWYVADDFFTIFVGDKQRPEKLANGLIGCIPHHPIMKEMIRRIELIDPTQIAVQPSHATTGPRLFSEVCKDKVHMVRVLPSHSFIPMHYDGRLCSPEQWRNAFAIHHWFSTQHPKINQAKGKRR